MNPVWFFLNGVPTGGVIAPSVSLAGDGSASAPAYSFASEPDTGMFHTGDDITSALRFSVNGTTQFMIGAAGDVLQVPSPGINFAQTAGGANGALLGWGAANRLDLASGDSLYIISGGLGVSLTPGAAGTVRAGGIIYGGGVISRLATVSTITTAGAVTFSAAEVAGGLILRDPNGAGRADLVPTAANLLAAIPSAQVGQAIKFTIRNTADAAETITVTTNTGVTLSGTMTIAQNNSKSFMAVFTNVTAASEAYTLYSLGTVVH